MNLSLKCRASSLALDAFYSVALQREYPLWWIFCCHRIKKMLMTTNPPRHLRAAKTITFSASPQVLFYNRRQRKLIKEINSNLCYNTCVEINKCESIDQSASVGRQPLPIFTGIASGWFIVSRIMYGVGLYWDMNKIFASHLKQMTLANLFARQIQDAVIISSPEQWHDGTQLASSNMWNIF